MLKKCRVVAWKKKLAEPWHLLEEISRSNAKPGIKWRMIGKLIDEQNRHAQCAVLGQLRKWS